MPYATAAKNLMLDALRGVNPTTPITHASLHNGDPGATGANELAGGAPPYARQPINFGAAVNGSIDSSNVPAFDVPAGATVTHVGFWSADVGGTFLGADPVPNENFTGQGSYTLTDADLDLNL